MVECVRVCVRVHSNSTRTRSSSHQIILMWFTFLLSELKTWLRLSYVFWYTKKQQHGNQYIIGIQGYHYLTNKPT